MSDRDYYANRLYDVYDELRVLRYEFLRDEDVPQWLKLRAQDDFDYAVLSANDVMEIVNYDQPLDGEE